MNHLIYISKIKVFNDRAEINEKLHERLAFAVMRFFCEKCERWKKKQLKMISTTLTHTQIKTVMSAYIFYNVFQIFVSFIFHLAASFPLSRSTSDS